MVHAEIYEKVKTEHARSLALHGSWSGMSAKDQAEAIAEEFGEWVDAHVSGNVDGEHGEIAELIQLANVCFRRIMVLTGEVGQ